MRNSNNPEAKNRKRQVALSNLEARLKAGGYTTPTGFVKYSEKKVESLRVEATILKGKITR